MPPFETLLVFCAAALALHISPGPSNFYVLSRSIAQGAGAGLVAAAGLAAGAMVHVIAAAAGLSLLFQVSATAYTVLKLAGAAYLIWLGIGYWREAGADLTVPEVARRPARTVFRQSVLVEVLNPKTALFFLAFLPQFADPAAGSVMVQIFVLGVISTLLAVPCDVAVAFASGGIARALGRSRVYRRLHGWLSGSILIGLGVFVALSRRTG